MIEQKRFHDDNEDVASYDFIFNFINENGFDKIYPLFEIKERSVCVGIAPGNKVEDKYVSDNKLIELVIDNTLVAMVYTRRDELNFTEATYIVIPDAFERAKKYRDKMLEYKNDISK